MREKKLQISGALISQLYCTLPKNERLHATYYLIMKCPKFIMKVLTKVALNESSDIDFQDTQRM